MHGIPLREGAPTLKLDLVNDTPLGGGLAGDVTDAFRDEGPFQIVLPEHA